MPPIVRNPFIQRAHRPTKRSRLPLLAAAVVTLGSIVLVLESVTLVRYSVDLVHGAWQRVTVRATDEPSPPSIFASETDRLCYYTRDVGLISELRDAEKTFCDAPSDAPYRRTGVSLLDLNSRGLNLRAMVFKRDFQLDFTTTTIHQPIASMAEDGGNHDPRFDWNPSMISCGCDELGTYALETFAESETNATLRLWDPQVAGTPEEYDEASTVCASPSVETSSSPVVEIHDKTILIARRDDHNPFFQVSSALNAWVLMKSLGWKKEETRVVHMDGGYPSQIDALHHRLLSTPSVPLLRGRDDLLGRRFKFTNDVLVAPYELSGPMMQHLNNKEPCFESHLFHEFRADALSVMGVRPRPNQHEIVVTIISRRNYGGRQVQRRWLNEDEVLDAMREKYPHSYGVPIVIQSIDFVDLTLKEQMEISLQSDVIIGMHGAGMVNVLWTKPKTLVIEIFPKRRRRWGYRNLCQFLGCDWHQFRGGQDTGRGDNRSDKTIPVDDWAAFFDPLFQEHLVTLAEAKQPLIVREQQRLRRH